MHRSGSEAQGSRKSSPPAPRVHRGGGSLVVMAAPVEVIVSSDSGSQLWNVSVLELHSGSSLLSYRGGNSAARGLAVLAGRYLLSAQLAKNFINVWEIHKKVGW